MLAFYCFINTSCCCRRVGPMPMPMTAVSCQKTIAPSEERECCQCWRCKQLTPFSFSLALAHFKVTFMRSEETEEIFMIIENLTPFSSVCLQGVFSSPCWLSAGCWLLKGKQNTCSIFSIIKDFLLKLFAFYDDATFCWGFSFARTVLGCPECSLKMCKLLKIMLRFFHCRCHAVFYWAS